MKINIRLIYLYLFSFVGLLVVIVGSVRMVDLGLKFFVFKDADQYIYYAPKLPDGTLDPGAEIAEKNAAKDQTRSRQRDFSGAASMILVGLPVYLYHWKTIQKENV